jgi:RecA/RadA recombinase
MLQSSYGKSAQMFGDPTTAIGGNIVGHASTYRMYLRRAKAVQELQN